MPFKMVSKYSDSIIYYVASDWKGFEAECKNIVKEIGNRFIDLGLEDHESDYGADQLQAKQERFEHELSKLPFTFDAHSLHFPAASAGAAAGQENVDEILEEEDGEIAAQFA